LTPFSEVEQVFSVHEQVRKKIGGSISDSNKKIKVKSYNWKIEFQQMEIITECTCQPSTW
jgi:hypothetical protein